MQRGVGITLRLRSKWVKNNFAPQEKLQSCKVKMGTKARKKKIQTSVCYFWKTIECVWARTAHFKCYISSGEKQRLCVSV